jgi:hypothetical protein
LLPGLDQNEIDQLKELKDSVIFLIDCHASMHSKPNPHNEAGISSIETVLKACLSFLKTKIITSMQDKVGVVLFGCA